MRVRQHRSDQAAGAGIGWLPRLNIIKQLHLEELAIMPLPKLAIHRPLYQVRHPERRLSNAARAFIESLEGGHLRGPLHAKQSDD